MHNWATLKEDTKWECCRCQEPYDDREYPWAIEMTDGMVCGACVEDYNS